MSFWTRSGKKSAPISIALMQIVEDFSLSFEMIFINPDNDSFRLSTQKLKQRLTFMSNKFFYLYLIGGTIGAALLVYDVITTYPKLGFGNLALDFLPAVFLYYLAYKTYHEKKDKEMM